MHPAKIQISLDTWLVWSEIWLSAQWIADPSGIRAFRKDQITRDIWLVWSEI